MNMRLKHVLVCIALTSSLGVSACSGSKIEQANIAISNCLSLYQELTNTHLSEAVDRAYVDVFPEGFIVLFANGENGLFGDRSESYSAILGCGVEANSREVFKIIEPDREAIYRTENADELYSLYMKYLTDGKVISYWFTRSSSGYLFNEKLIFSKELLDQLNSSDLGGIHKME